jgi:phage baseplate assembly protein W
MPAPSLTKRYSDIDFAFTRTPGKNDIALSYDEMAVVRAVRYLLLTNNYERPFQPEIGSNVTKLLFEPIDSITTQSLKSSIENTINNFEPRVTLSNVTVIAKEEKNAYDVSLEFFIGNNTQPTEISLMLKRTR